LLGFFVANDLCVRFENYLGYAVKIAQRQKIAFCSFNVDNKGIRPPFFEDIVESVTRNGDIRSGSFTAINTGRKKVVGLEKPDRPTIDGQSFLP
jgi:hypothetical protein